MLNTKKWTPKKRRLALEMLRAERNATEFLIMELRKQKENKSEPPLDPQQKMELKNLYSHRERVKKLTKKMKEKKHD